MARQMVFVLAFAAGETRREEKPFAIDAAPFGFGAKVGRGMAGGKPQHAVVDIRKQPHPDVEYFGRDPDRLVEGAEHEAALR